MKKQQAFSIGICYRSELALYLEQQQISKSIRYGKVLVLGIPLMVSLFINSLYNFVDSMFVSQVSEKALTALSLAAPVQLKRYRGSTQGGGCGDFYCPLFMGFDYQPMSIQMSMYGGFEQAGSFGTSLPRDDEQTTTQAADIDITGDTLFIFPEGACRRAVNSASDA